MTTENVSIKTARGYELAGALELPDGDARGAAVFAHCFTCTKQSRAAVEVARALAKHGIATLRFDFTGLGGSGGDFGQAGFASDLEDLVETACYLAERFGPGLLLVGHSLGGAAVLAAAAEVGAGRVAAIATIGAPAEVPHVLGNIVGDLDAVKRDGEVEASRSNIMTSCSFFSSAPCKGGIAALGLADCSTSSGISSFSSNLSQSSSSLVLGFFLRPGTSRIS